jgi:FkbM family methyltransferase
MNSVKSRPFGAFLKPGALLYYLQSIFTLWRGVQNRSVLVRLALQLPIDRPFEVRLRNGSRFSVLTIMDVWVLKETILDRVYEKVGTSLQKGWNVVDIGAAQGDFAVWAGRQVNPGRLIAIEPFPQSFDLLRENVASNDLTNVTAHEAAIASQNGRARLNLVTGEAAQHSTADGSFGKGQMEVNTLTLAELFSIHSLEHCDFLKMDCEGAEYDILFHASSEVLQKVARICMEVHDGVTPYSREDMRQFLQGSGYRVKITPNPVHQELAYLFAERYPFS